jgi:uncharacterized protein (DUF1501 family)
MSHDHDHDHADDVPARVRAAATEGCPESRLLISRRGALGISAGLFSSAFVPKWAEAATSDPRLLIVVLRGGMDGVNTVIPHGDPAYASMRGGIAIPRANSIALNSFFSLNAALPTFGTMYRAREASVVHATSVPLTNRSHFDCQDNLENGLPGLGSNTTGWMNRLLTALPTGSPIKTYGAIQIGDAPLLLRGPAPVLGWSPTWFEHPRAEIRDPVRGLLYTTDRPLYDALERGLRADALAESVNSGEDPYVSSFRKSFRGAGRLLAAANGPRMAVLSVDNFDTHSQQGTTGGYLFDALTELDTGLKEFRTYVGALWAKTVVLMVTEFGRTVKVNGDLGTDHGVGTVALLAGGAVAGGRVVGDWPGIRESQLFEQSDLRPTTDLRAVFKGVLRDHIGVPTSILDTTIFPSSAAVKPVDGLVKTSTTAATRTAGRFGEAPLRPVSGIAEYRAANAG